MLKVPEGIKTDGIIFTSDINNQGQVLGFYGGGGFGGGGAGRKFLYVMDNKGKIIDFPQLERINGQLVVAQPYAINDNGVIVGQYFFTDPSLKQGYNPDNPSGYIIQDGKIKLLNSSGTSLFAPISLNNQDVIVGFFDGANGNRHGFRASLDK